jgi:hypothetical protein
MTLEERRRRITERKLEWLEEFYCAWLRNDGLKIYNGEDRRQARKDYMAMREAIIAEGDTK